MAFCFGSAPEIAAFMVAYRLANLFRRLFGEGNLQSGFVPQFESLKGENSKTAFFFYRDSSFSFLIVLLGVVAFIEGGLWFGSQFLESQWGEITHLAMWMSPGLVFVCLYALNSAFLQCQKSYFVPAAAPILFNGAWVGAAFFAFRFPVVVAVQILSVGVTAAFAFQWLMTAISVRKKLSIYLTWREWFQPRLFSSEWKKILKPLTLGIAGMGAMQINGAFDAIFARIADLSGPAYLWYAIRIQQLPLALFGIALSGALLPPLSRAMRDGDVERYRTFLQLALRHCVALMIPCMFGIYALGGCGLNLLYGHGKFQANDVIQTLYCLWGYASGLIPAVFVILLATGFYARKSYFIPTLASISSVILNIVLNALMVFVFHWGAVSIAIGTSVAALANCLILAVGLRKEVGSFFNSAFWNCFIRLFTCGGFAALLTFLVGFRADAFPRSFLEQMMRFGGAALFFSVSFFVLAYVMKIKELFDLFKRPVPG